jgi:hypothetical protein
MHLTVSLSDQPESIAAQTRHVRVGNAQHGIRGDGGVNGPSAAVQYIQSGAARQEVRGRNDTARRAR